MINPINFIHDVKYDDIPKDVLHQTKRCLIDTIGVAFGGYQTELSQIIYRHAKRVYGGTGGTLWFDGSELSPAGAALAQGMSIDSYDLHDSCRPIKGHVGVAQVPAALNTLALDAAGDISGKELLATLTMAYDICTRTGTAQHNTVCDYHTSGSWNAVGAAAVTARRMKLDYEQTRHALGIAEYHGPRSQMMRAIDYPTMVKDGSGWGAMTGVSAALMASDGFTGAPAITVEAEYSKQDITQYWDTLGDEWRVMIQYFKPYAVCYWAQPAIAGAVNLQEEHNIDPRDITKIKVFTFHESSRLAMRHPKTTDEAQYSLPFPIAGALVHDQLFLDELTGDSLAHPEVNRLSALVELVDDDYFNDRFPAERLSRVEITMQDGTVHDSGVVRPKWDLSTPPEDIELLEKFRTLANQYTSQQHASELEDMLWNIESLDNVSELVTLLAKPL